MYLPWRKYASKPSLAEKIEEEKPKPKVETAPVMDKQPKAPSLPPSKHSATEPQLPPEDREGRVSFVMVLYLDQKMFVDVY